MKNNGISIIIPCYNVEKYIETCIDSILNESFKKYEIILIDDKSTDNTLKIIKNYEKKYEFIKVLENNKNSGAGVSRNKALKIAKYDLISFIDSDDYVEENFHEILLKSLIDNNADISVCDFYIRYSDDFEETDEKNYACNGKVTKMNIIDNGLAASPCNKLFKKEILLNNLFAEGIMNEDVPAVIGSLIDANKISYTNDTFYNYLQRKSSVQNEKISFKRFDIFKALDILNDRKKDNKVYLDSLDSLIFNQIILFFIYVIPKEKNFLYRYKLLRKFYKDSKKYNLRLNNHFWNFLTAQNKISILYYKIMFKLNCNGFSMLTNLEIQFYKFYKKNIKKSVIKNQIDIKDLIKCSKKQSKLKSKINLSVVIPNYNYNDFLYQRIFSILNQKEKITELIILDDCSTDNSRETIDFIVDNLSKYINIKKVYNKENSGTAFKQWKKGFEIAKGDYIWIAEADDYSEKDFLSNVIKPILNDDKIVISYCDTAFIDKTGKIILKTIKPEIDILKTGHWDNDYVNNGIDEIKKYSYLNCTIANVSSVVFKKQDYQKFFEKSSQYRQAGDWLFYVNVMETGKIAYSNKALNYYRLHGNNVTSLTKKVEHLKEIKKVHNELNKKYKFSKKQENNIEERYKFLNKVWNIE